MPLDDFLDAWRVSNAINLELLALCGDDTFELKPGKGKTIRSNFVHIVSVRRAFIEEKLPKEAVALPKLDWKSASREEIVSGLQESSKLVEALLSKQNEKPGKWT